MEPPRRAIAVERSLAALILAAAAAAAWATRGCELSSHIQNGTPWLAWIEAHQSSPSLPTSFHLAAYDPVLRLLSIAHLPGKTKFDDLPSIEGASAPTAILRADLPALLEEDEPSVATSLALKARASSPRAWLSLARALIGGTLSGDKSPLENFIFALELRSVRLENIRSGRMPENAESLELLGWVLAADLRRSKEKAITAEVLNGVGEAGLASRASKMLRLRGIDVMAMGGSRPRKRTLVYDRVGDFRRAAEARNGLGCPSARTATRVDPSRAVDVSVELGEDCAEAFGRAVASGP